MCRNRSSASASASCSAASTGSRGKPSARGSTLVPPPGTNPSGKSSRSTPFRASLKPPSPEKTISASASAASRASSTAWRGRSVRTVRTYAARINARSTAVIRSSVTRLAKGLTISTARFIAGEHAMHRSRRRREPGRGARRCVLRAVPRCTPRPQGRASGGLFFEDPDGRKLEAITYRDAGVT